MPLRIRTVATTSSLPLGWSAFSGPLAFRLKEN